MLPAVRLLLTAADDAALTRAVAAAGETSHAVRLLFDHAFGLQQAGASHAEILARWLRCRTGLMRWRGGVDRTGAASIRDGKRDMERYGVTAATLNR